MMSYVILTILILIYITKTKIKTIRTKNIPHFSVENIPYPAYVAIIEVHYIQVYQETTEIGTVRTFSEGVLCNISDNV